MKKKIVTLQIGNSDDKLTQLQWSNFVDTVGKAIALFGGKTHFSAGSSNEKPWQNYCWVFELNIDPLVTQSFQKQLKEVRKHFQQDSVAWTEGNTEFI